MSEASDARGLRDMPARLVVVEGDEVGLVFTIGPVPKLLGRGEDADLSVQGAGVSRHHALVSRGLDGRILVTDLDSANGTFVNGQRVRRTSMDPGDRMCIGGSVVLEAQYLSPDHRETLDLLHPSDFGQDEASFAALRNEGRLQLTQGDPQTALHLLLRAKDRLEQGGEPAPRELAVLLGELGECHLALRDRSTADPLFRRACALLEDVGASPRELAPVRFGLARALEAIDPTQARSLALLARDAVLPSHPLYPRITDWLEAPPG